MSSVNFLAQDPPRNAPVRSFRARPANVKKLDPFPPHGSELFEKKLLFFQSGKSETAVFGGREQLPLVAEAFDAAGIRQILFIGWHPAHAQNLRDTLFTIGRTGRAKIKEGEKGDIKVSVGLGGNSSFIEDAREAGFDEGDGTLGDPCKLGGQSDLVCLVEDRKS